MARKLIALIKPMPPEPISRMTEEELDRYAKQLCDEHISPALRRAGIKPKASEHPSKRSLDE